MIDPEIEELMIERTWLVENIVRLNGPIDPIFHLYDRNFKSLALMERLLNADSFGPSILEKMTQSYLDQYSKEYLKTLFEFISASLMSPQQQARASLRVIRRSRHYLPGKITALGQMFGHHHHNFEPLLTKWLLNKLTAAFPLHKHLFIAMFDPKLMPNYHRYIDPLLKRCTNMKISPKSELERTDSFTQLRHMSCLSRRCTSSPDSPSDSSGSSSKTQSPVFAELPTQSTRECCPNHSHHQFVILSWLRENRLKLTSNDHQEMEKDLEKLMWSRSSFNKNKSKSQPYYPGPVSASNLPEASSSGLGKLKVQNSSKPSVLDLIINQ